MSPSDLAAYLSSIADAIDAQPDSAFDDCTVRTEMLHLQSLLGIRLAETRERRNGWARLGPPGTASRVGRAASS